VIGHPIKTNSVLQQSQPRPSPPLPLVWRCGRLRREEIGSEPGPDFRKRFARIANRTLSDSFRFFLSSSLSLALLVLGA
jgi:hypothetical protein